jgi:hypothetical protein
LIDQYFEEILSRHSAEEGSLVLFRNIGSVSPAKLPLQLKASSEAQDDDVAAAKILLTLTADILRNSTNKAPYGSVEVGYEDVLNLSSVYHSSKLNCVFLSTVLASISQCLQRRYILSCIGCFE